MIFKPRQMMLAKMVSEGLTYAEIAEYEKLSPQTVKIYVEDIAVRIRGNLPTKTKVAVWYRIKCGLSVLTGEPITPLSNRNGAAPR